MEEITREASGSSVAVAVAIGGTAVLVGVAILGQRVGVVVGAAGSVLFIPCASSWMV